MKIVNIVNNIFSGRHLTNACPTYPITPFYKSKESLFCLLSLFIYFFLTLFLYLIISCSPLVFHSFYLIFSSSLVSFLPSSPYLLFYFLSYFISLFNYLSLSPCLPFFLFLIILFMNVKFAAWVNFFYNFWFLTQKFLSDNFSTVQ